VDCGAARKAHQRHLCPGGEAAFRQYEKMRSKRWPGGATWSSPPGRPGGGPGEHGEPQGALPGVLAGGLAGDDLGTGANANAPAAVAGPDPMGKIRELLAAREPLIARPMCSSTAVCAPRGKWPSRLRINSRWRADSEDGDSRTGAGAGFDGCQFTTAQPPESAAHFQPGWKRPPRPNGLPRAQRPQTNRPSQCLRRCGALLRWG